MKRILLTGHLGYIGAVLVPMLQDRGDRVLGVDAGFFAHWAVAGGTNAPLDIRRLDPTALHAIDAIIHLAALSNDPMGQLNPVLTDAINHRASVRLAQLARQAGVRRFVFASSCSLYGASDTSRLLDETADFSPVSAYARSKVDAEAGISALADRDFSPVFLRNATAWGLSPAMRFDLVANNLTGWAVTSGHIRLESDGSPWRPLVHVEDIAQACVAAVDAPQEAVHGQAFNIGRDDQNFQVREIAEIVCAAVPSSEVIVGESAGPDTRSYRVSFAKAARGLPGFHARRTLEAGVGRMAAFFRDRGLTLAQFQGPRYNRLVQLQELLRTGEVDQDLYWTEKVKIR